MKTYSLAVNFTFKAENPKRAEGTAEIIMEQLFYEFTNTRKGNADQWPEVTKVEQDGQLIEV